MAVGQVPQAEGHTGKEQDASHRQRGSPLFRVPARQRQTAQGDQRRKVRQRKKQHGSQQAQISPRPGGNKLHTGDIESAQLGAVGIKLHLCAAAAVGQPEVKHRAGTRRRQHGGIPAGGHGVLSQKADLPVLPVVGIGHHHPVAAGRQVRRGGAGKPPGKTLNVNTLLCDHAGIGGRLKPVRPHRHGRSGAEICGKPHQYKHQLRQQDRKYGKKQIFSVCPFCLVRHTQLFSLLL